MTADELVAAITRMTAAFAKPPAWRKLVTNCFAQDFSWAQSARRYLDWFDALTRTRGAA